MDCHTAIENLSDPIGYLLDFTNPYYTALAGNMKARAKKDNSFWNNQDGDPQVRLSLWRRYWGNSKSFVIFLLKLLSCLLNMLKN